MAKIHSYSDVQTNAIGNETVIWQYVVILPGAVIGNNCNINCHVFIENDVVLGDYVTIKSGVQLWDGLRIGNQVFIGPNVSFVNDKYPRSKIYPGHFQKTTIDDGASIGAGSVILGGINIGKGAMIGAGSVITRNIPPCTVWYGNPARHNGYITQSGEILDMNFKSKNGKKYKFDTNSCKFFLL
jgi:UDP-2-acetamido-3-amino-2,3-dideoxy-glucuronate N-acetyltransferase